MATNKYLEKSIDSLIDSFLSKAEKKMKHDYPKHNVMDDLIGPAQDLENDAPVAGEFSPTSPDYGMQPSDMKNEQGAALNEARKGKVTKAPTSPDYGEQPEDLEEGKLSKDDDFHAENPIAPSRKEPTSPDEGEQPEKTYEEEAGDRGRPAETHYVPDVDDELSDGLGYNNVQFETAKIEDADEESEPHADENDEDVKKVKKGFLISKSDYELLLRAKKMMQKRELEKSMKMQETLIKSVVSNELQSLKHENEELKKMIKETNSMMKSFGSRPQERKSVANVTALNKSFVNRDEIESPQQFSKSEILDATERLVKSGALPVNALIEIERSKHIENPMHRKLIERELLTPSKK